jgi:hypothetical protein
MYHKTFCYTLKLFGSPLQLSHISENQFPKCDVFISKLKNCRSQFDEQFLYIHNFVDKIVYVLHLS